MCKAFPREKKHPATIEFSMVYGVGSEFPCDGPKHYQSIAGHLRWRIEGVMALLVNSCNL